MDYLSVADRSWPFLNRLMGGHTAIYRATNGRLGHRLPGFGPVLLLDHVGARTGTRRTSPLLYARDGEDVVVVASKGGYPTNPGWFYNLMANPDTSIQIGAERMPVHARVADARERARLWPKMVEVYATYDDYQRRAPRQIPLVILEPR